MVHEPHAERSLENTEPRITWFLCLCLTNSENTSCRQGNDPQPAGTRPERQLTSIPLKNARALVLVTGVGVEKVPCTVYQHAGEKNARLDGDERHPRTRQCAVMDARLSVYRDLPVAAVSCYQQRYDMPRLLVPQVFQLRDAAEAGPAVRARPHE